MSSISPSFEHDPRILAKYIFYGAKFYWGMGLLAKIIGAGFGIYFIAEKVTSSLAPGSIVILAIGSEFCQWRSDILKGRAEGITRKVEYQDAFGWNFPTKDLSDQLTKIPAKKRAEIAQAVKDNYFASKEPQSPKRAMENLQESAWWSKELAGTMLALCSIIMVIFLLGTLAMFSVSINTIRDYGALQSVNRVITSILSLLVSLGLIKTVVGYYNFSRKAEQTEQATIVLLKSNPVDEKDAIRLLHDYQLGRASAPLIPDWLWKLRAPTLNDLWKKYRQS